MAPTVKQLYCMYCSECTVMNCNENRCNEWHFFFFIVIIKETQLYCMYCHYVHAKTSLEKVTLTPHYCYCVVLHKLKMLKYSMLQLQNKGVSVHSE